MEQKNNSDQEKQSHNNGGVQSGGENGSLSHALPYIEYIARQLKEDLFAQHFRLTSKGLVVAPSGLELAIDIYFAWLKSRTSDNVEVTRQKAFKRLFQSESPAKIYLPEGRVCFTGHLIECVIQNVPNYRRAYYLGSPVSALDYIHPNDPDFSGHDGLALTEGRDGVQISVRNKRGELRAGLGLIKIFRDLAPGSHKLQGEFPRNAESLSQTALTLGQLILRSRFIKPGSVLLVPLGMEREAQKLEVREAFGFYFFFDTQGNLKEIFHSYGKNFALFLREEFSKKLAGKVRGHLGSFQFLPARDPCLGSFDAHSKRRGLAPRALADFLSEFFAEDLQPAFKPPRTVQGYLEDFVIRFQLAEPISKHLVASYLERHQLRNHRYWVNQEWLFIESDEFIITNCLSRSSKNRSAAPRRPR